MEPGGLNVERVRALQRGNRCPGSASREGQICCSDQRFCALSMAEQTSESDIPSGPNPGVKDKTVCA